MHGELEPIGRFDQIDLHGDVHHINPLAADVNQGVIATLFTRTLDHLVGIRVDRRKLEIPTVLIRTHDSPRITAAMSGGIQPGLHRISHPVAVSRTSKFLTLEIPGDVADAPRLPDLEKAQRLCLELSGPPAFAAAAPLQAAADTQGEGWLQVATRQGPSLHDRITPRLTQLVEQHHFRLRPSLVPRVLAEAGEAT